MTITDNYVEKITNLAKIFNDNNQVAKRLAFINGTVEDLNNHQIPTQQFFNLVFTETEIIEVLQDAAVDFEEAIISLEELDNLFSYFRQFLQEEYGYWATITQPFMGSFVSEISANKYLELMAGNGYISEALRDTGKTVFTIDSKTWSETSETGKEAVTDIEQLDAVAAFDKYVDQVEVIILAWSPDFDEIDYQILEKYRKIEGPKPLFFIIGEQNGATNSKKFWKSVKLVADKRVDKINENYPQYDIVDDKLYLIE